MSPILCVVQEGLWSGVERERERERERGFHVPYPAPIESVYSFHQVCCREGSLLYIMARTQHSAAAFSNTRNRRSGHVDTYV